NGAAGVVSSAKLFRPEDFAELTTPSAALSVASQLLVDAAATPPRRGGEYATFNISSIRSHLHRPPLQFYILGIFCILACFATPLAPKSWTTAPSPPQAGVVGAVYPNKSLQALGAPPPYTWTLVAGSLPGGLALSSTGLFFGTPSAAGTFNFVVLVTDSAAS